MDIHVFDINFKRLGIIDVYEELEIVWKEDDHSTLTLNTDATDNNIDLLIFGENELRILTTGEDFTKGFLIESGKYDDKNDLTIEVNARSMSIITSFRIVEGQQLYSGTVDSVLKSFVTNNAINPSDPNRIIPNLILDTSISSTLETEESYANKELDVVLWEICNKFDIWYEVRIDHVNKKFVLHFHKGVNRADDQNDVPRIIFSKQFDNVIMQSYIHDISGYRNTAYVIGGDDWEDEPATIVKVNDENSGWNRREIFLEATDLRREYVDENDDDIFLTQEQFNQVLTERGKNRLYEYPVIRTFESDIDVMSRYQFNKHYFISDIVTCRNIELGMSSNDRISRVIQKYSKTGYSLKIELGPGVPKLIDKIKRKVK